MMNAIQDKLRKFCAIGLYNLGFITDNNLLVTFD